MKPYLTLLLLCAISLRADDAAPRLAPGQTLTFRFPEMPATFAERLDPKNIPPMMTVFLPRNYDPQRKHPLLIFLSGGGGSRGQNPTVARKLTEEKDFICVDMPLFKKKLDPPTPTNKTARLVLQADDCRYMWSFHKVMLAKLEETVPNIDPAHRVLGGFSNGAHATAGLIDQSDGEIARRFTAFFFGEGGGRLQHYELLKGKPFLMLYGSEQSGKRAKEIYAAAVAAGAKATLHEMKGVGHAFPESQYPAVRAWLRGEPQPAADAAPAGATQDVKETQQTKTGTVRRVDANARQLTVMAAREMMFTVTDSTKITQGGKPCELADIKPGDMVVVDYVKSGETRTARKIEVRNGKSPTAPAPGPGDSHITVPVGAQTRTCAVHLPASHDDGRLRPVVMAFHGSGGTGRGMAAMTGFNALADKHSFIAVYPDAIIGKGLWNALFGKLPGGEGVLADDVDDVAFVRALIDLLVQSYRADPNRIFACGHSAGAYMSYRLAVELSDRIAAVGIVNGSLGIKSLDGKPVPCEIPKPAAPVSVMHICGKLDRSVKFEGAQTPKNLFKSAPDCVQFFVKANGCAPAGKEMRDDAHGVTRTLYTGGKGGTEVELIVVDKCGHTWPTAQHGLSASQTLWEFFSKHPKQTR
ncbi:MAG: alpha/beta hydrolase-fold protein [Verrucomicrobiae bacterium]|nr:alpha/beta hydrolase-fold protein [Verrucomicrobiae bacterium]